MAVSSNQMIAQMQAKLKKMENYEQKIKEFEEQRQLAEKEYEKSVQEYYAPFIKWLNNELVKRGLTDRYSLEELQAVIESNFFGKNTETEKKE